MSTALTRALRTPRLDRPVRGEIAASGRGPATQRNALTPAVRHSVSMHAGWQDDASRHTRDPLHHKFCLTHALAAACASRYSPCRISNVSRNKMLNTGISSQSGLGKLRVQFTVLRPVACGTRVCTDMAPAALRWRILTGGIDAVLSGNFHSPSSP